MGDDDGGDGDGQISPEHPSPILHAPRDIISRKGKSLTPIKVLYRIVASVGLYAGIIVIAVRNLTLGGMLSLGAWRMSLDAVGKLFRRRRCRRPRPLLVRQFIERVVILSHLK